MVKQKDGSVALRTYRELEERIRENEQAGLHARWAFGRALLAERDENGGKKLPDRRLAELANALAISRAEIKNRMQFAARYPTEEDVRGLGAVSWHEICRARLGERSTATEARLKSSPRDHDDAFRVPERLRPRLAAVTRAAHTAGRISSDNLGSGVAALLDFVEGGGRKPWTMWLGPARKRARAAA